MIGKLPVDGGIVASSDPRACGDRRFGLKLIARAVQPLGRVGVIEAVAHEAVQQQDLCVCTRDSVVVFEKENRCVMMKTAKACSQTRSASDKIAHY